MRKPGTGLLLGLLLSVLLVGFGTSKVLADDSNVIEVNTVDELQQAVSQPGKAVRLMKDLADHDLQIVMQDDDVVLDLNGHRLTNSNEDGFAVTLIDISGSNIKIMNGTLCCSSPYAYGIRLQREAGNLVLEDLTLQGSFDSQLVCLEDSTPRNVWLYDCEFTMDGESAYFSSAIMVQGGTRMSIDGGRISDLTADMPTNRALISVDETSSLTMYGVELERRSTGYLAEVWRRGIVPSYNEIFYGNYNYPQVDGTLVSMGSQMKEAAGTSDLYYLEGKHLIPNYRTQKLNKVEVYVSEPAVLEEADWTPSFGESRWMRDFYSNQGYYSGVSWTYVSDEGGGYLMPGEFYKPGSFHTLYLRLLPEPGWTYEEDGFTATVNGEKASIEIYDGHIHLYYVFDQLPDYPVIWNMPESQTAAPGQTVKFSANAYGDDSFIDQWQYRTSEAGEWQDVKADSGKTATLTFTAQARHNGYQYRYSVTNPNCGLTSYSDPVTLTVKKVSITKQPAAQNVKEGAAAKFTVKVDGVSPKYQWQYSKNGMDWTDCKASTATKATLSFDAKASHHGNQYRCVITDAGKNTVTSKAVRLNVLAIKTPPADCTVAAGSKATFKVAAIGDDITYQWYYTKNEEDTWHAVSAASGKTAVYSLTAETRHNGYQYRCKVKNAAGTFTTVEATLTVVTKPAITTQPKNKMVKAGSTAKFTVAAEGGDLSYQWYYRTSSTAEWTRVTAAKGKTANYSMTAAARHNGYQYRCKVWNAAGKVFTKTVTLTVTS